MWSRQILHLRSSIHKLNALHWDSVKNKLHLICLSLLTDSRDSIIVPLRTVPAALPVISVVGNPVHHLVPEVEVAPVYRVEYQEQEWRQNQEESVHSGMLIIPSRKLSFWFFFIFQLQTRRADTLLSHLNLQSVVIVCPGVPGVTLPGHYFHYEMTSVQSPLNDDRDLDSVIVMLLSFSFDYQQMLIPTTTNTLL